MEKRRLGVSSVDVSVIGLGGLHFGVYLDETQSTRLVHHALDRGVNLIDTGPLYGNGQSETIVGKAIKGRRDQVVLTTKVGLARRTLPDGSFGVEVVPLRADRIRECLEQSLRALGTDHVDLFQFHAFDADTPVEDSFEVMDKLVAEGKILAVGASNYDPAELSAVVRAIGSNGWAPLVALESHYNMIERMVEKDLLPICADNGVGVIPYRSLARGILTGKYRLGGPIPEKSRAADSWRVRNWLQDETLALVAALEAFALKHGRSVVELSLAWLLAQPLVPTVLIGARDIEQFDACANAATWSLSTAELAEIDAIVSTQGQSERVLSLPEVYFEK